MKYTVTKITNKPDRFNWRKSPGGWKAIQKDNRKDQQKSWDMDDKFTNSWDTKGGGYLKKWG